LAVVRCDPSSSHVWLIVGGGERTSICGMAKDKKILVFFETFFRITKS